MQYGFDGCPKTFGVFEASFMRSRLAAAHDRSIVDIVYFR